LIWIAAKSDARGIARALPSLKKAKTMIREADACATDDPRHALDLLKQATILQPQNWEYHDKLAELLIDIDPHSNAKPAIAALRHSSALAPARGRSTRLLCQLLNKLGRHDEALAEAEFACIRWPDKTWPWLIARRSVVRGWQVKHQCLIDHAMLMQAPALDKVHRNLAQTHKLMKKTKMAKRRKEHATALTK
jgi:tetratricopeptide (TPR) repeat protein